MKMRNLISDHPFGSERASYPYEEIVDRNRPPMDDTPFPVKWLMGESGEFVFNDFSEEWQAVPLSCIALIKAMPGLTLPYNMKPVVEMCTSDMKCMIFYFAEPKQFRVVAVPAPGKAWNGRRFKNIKNDGDRDIAWTVLKQVRSYFREFYGGQCIWSVRFYSYLERSFSSIEVESFLRKEEI